MRLIALLSLVMLLCAVPTANAALTDGLNSYWDMEGNTIDTAGNFAGNASSVQDNGTVEGTPGSVSFGDGKWGQAAILDGEDGYVSVPDSADLAKGGQSLSIAAWFRVDAFDTGWQALVAKGEGSNYRVARQDPTNSMSYAGGATDLRDGPDVNDGAWHHIVATTEEGGLTQFFIDGALVEDLSTRDPGATASIVDERSSDPAALWIGNNPGAPGREWEGGIDDLAIWNRVLTQSEITYLQTNPVPEPGTLGMLAAGLLGLMGWARRRR